MLVVRRNRRADGAPVSTAATLVSRAPAVVVVLGMAATSGCGPKSYVRDDAHRLAMMHAREPERAEAIAAGRRCDRADDLADCAFVAEAMERANEKNDALSLYDHACRSGLLQACEAAARVRSLGVSRNPPSARRAGGACSIG